MKLSALVDPITGQPVYGPTGTRKLVAAASALVAFVLTTPLGSCGADPTLGLDLTGLDAGALNARATFNLRVTSALDRYVRAGRLADVRVTSEVQGDALVFEVSFRDPREQTSQTFKGTVTP